MPLRLLTSKTCTPAMPSSGATTLTGMHLRQSSQAASWKSGMIVGFMLCPAGMNGHLAAATGECNEFEKFHPEALLVAEPGPDREVRALTGQATLRPLTRPAASLHLWNIVGGLCQSWPFQGLGVCQAWQLPPRIVSHELQDISTPAPQTRHIGAVYCGPVWILRLHNIAPPACSRASVVLPLVCTSTAHRYTYCCS